MAKRKKLQAVAGRQVAVIVRVLQSAGVDVAFSDKHSTIASKVWAYTHMGNEPPPIGATQWKRQILRDFYDSLKPDVKLQVIAKTKGIGAKAAKPSAYDVRRAERQAFYLSNDWRYVRYQALKRSRGVCELCGVAPTPGHPLHVDHIKPRSKYPELEYDISNLQILCDDCNLGKGNRDEIDWRRDIPA